MTTPRRDQKLLQAAAAAVKGRVRCQGCGASPPTGETFATRTLWRSHKPRRVTLCPTCDAKLDRKRGKR